MLSRIKIINYSVKLCAYIRVVRYRTGTLTEVDAVNIENRVSSVSRTLVIRYPSHLTRFNGPLYSTSKYIIT